MTLDEIKSTGQLTCLFCGATLTMESWSGWEYFLPDGKTTQAVCKFCDMVASTTPIVKELDDGH